MNFLKDKKHRFKILFALLLSLFLAGCTSFLEGPQVSVSRTGIDGNQTSNAIPAGTDPENHVLGRKEHARIISSFGGVYRNRKIEIMVAQIAGKLLRAANIGNSSYNVTLLDSPEVNAFALPGGYIYVTRGVLALANDQSELAAVLAHEISHVVLRHARERTNRTKTSEIVDRVITGVLGGDADTDQGASRSRLSLAAFSQSQELAADKQGVLIAARAGFDPFAAGRLLNSMARFAQLDVEGYEEGDDFLSTHPSTPDRIQKTLEIANSFNDSKFANSGGKSLDRTKYLKAIDGLSFGQSGSQGAVIGQKFVHRNLKFTFKVPKRYSLQNSKTAVVAVAGESEALRFDSAQVPVSMSLVEYLSTGWIVGLDPESVKELKNNDIEMANIEMAMGKAKTQAWEFIIYVIRFNGEVYRFIFAAKKDSAEFRKAAQDVAQSFRKITARDIAQIQNNYIKIITAEAGDDIDDLSKKMIGQENSDGLFLVLNNLYLRDPIIANQQYKIVRVK